MTRSCHIFILIALALLTSCNGNRRPTPAAVTDARPVEIHRLDRAVITADTAAVTAMEPGARLWMLVTGISPDDPDAAGKLIARGIDKPYNAPTLETWATTDSLSRQLGYIFNNVAEYLGTEPPAGVYAVVSPYNQSVVTADSCIFIALNHYLGAGNELYGYFPDYIRRLKEPSRVGIDVAEAIVSRDFPFNPGTDYHTLLSRLAYEGAVVEAVMRLTGADEATALGFSPEDYKWLQDNERDAWSSLVGRKMLFSTDPLTADALVRPNAVASALHHEAPGRSGRFIGHRLVESYLKSHPDASLEFLLSPEFYNSPSLLADAGYEGS